MVLSFIPVKVGDYVGDYYSLLYNCPSSRSVGLFFARSVTEPSIYTTLLFNIVPGPYPYAQPSPNFESYDSYSTPGTSEQTFPAAFSHYEPHERYPPQPSF